jgi:hypothetical protein
LNASRSGRRTELCVPFSLPGGIPAGDERREPQLAAKRGARGRRSRLEWSPAYPAERSGRDVGAGLRPVLSGLGEGLGIEERPGARCRRWSPPSNGHARPSTPLGLARAAARNRRGSAARVPTTTSTTPRAATRPLHRPAGGHVGGPENALGGQRSARTGGWCRAVRRACRQCQRRSANVTCRLVGTTRVRSDTAWSNETFVFSSWRPAVFVWVFGCRIAGTTDSFRGRGWRNGEAKRS